MAQAVNRLTARAVATLKKPGRHSDGGGLYLSISPDGSRRRWVFLFRWSEPNTAGPGKLREMGLGSATMVSLARAREVAAHARTLLASGQNPLTEREAKPQVPTFAVMAEEVISSLETGWRNPKHRDQWRMTLTRYCEPLAGIPVDAVNTDHVLAVLKPLWLKVPETASRLRGRIEKVLDAARAGASHGREPGPLARPPRSSAPAGS